MHETYRGVVHTMNFCDTSMRPGAVSGSERFNPPRAFLIVSPPGNYTALSHPYTLGQTFPSPSTLSVLERRRTSRTPKRPGPHAPPQAPGGRAHSRALSLPRTDSGVPKGGSIPRMPMPRFISRLPEARILVDAKFVDTWARV